MMWQEILLRCNWLRLRCRQRGSDGGRDETDHTLFGVFFVTHDVYYFEHCAGTVLGR